MIKTIDVSSVYKLIDYLLSRRDMFDINSLVDLKQFLAGYGFAVKTRNISDQDLEGFEGFGSFIKEVYETETTNWAAILKSKSNSDPDSFELFRRKLDEYRKRVAN